jgi:hypothetical protein
MARAGGADEAGGGFDDLGDDSVKLVAYTIVSVKRDEERALPKGSDTIVVTSSLSRETFTSWVIARYLQSTAYKELAAEEQVEEDDRRYLRVHYVVPRRWPREPAKFQERQIDALRGLRDARAAQGRAARSAAPGEGRRDD